MRLSLRAIPSSPRSHARKASNTWSSQGRLHTPARAPRGGWGSSLASSVPLDSAGNGPPPAGGLPSSCTGNGTPPRSARGTREVRKSAVPPKLDAGFPRKRGGLLAADAAATAAAGVAACVAALSHRALARHSVPSGDRTHESKEAEPVPGRANCPHRMAHASFSVMLRNFPPQSTNKRDGLLGSQEPECKAKRGRRGSQKKTRRPPR